MLLPDVTVGDEVFADEDLSAIFGVDIDAPDTTVGTTVPKSRSAGSVARKDQPGKRARKRAKDRASIAERSAGDRARKKSNGIKPPAMPSQPSAQWIDGLRDHLQLSPNRFAARGECQPDNRETLAVLNGTGKTAVPALAGNRGPPRQSRRTGKEKESPTPVDQGNRVTGRPRLRPETAASFRPGCAESGLRSSRVVPSPG